MPALSPVIAITGLGLTSAVGQGAAATAAAVRAGIARFRLSEQIQVAADRGGAALEDATVATVPTIDARLAGPERAGALLAPALRESLESARLGPQDLAGVTWELESWIEPPAGARRARQVTMLSDLVPGLPPDVGLKPAFASRHPGLRQCALIHKIMDAGQVLARDRSAKIVIGVVDSLATPPASIRLAEDGALKSAVKPDGIVPGEAAGAFVLEDPDSAARRKAEPLAIVEACGQGIEPNPWIDSGVSTAQGLTEALREVVGALGDGAGGIGLVVSDLNGERARALEWSLAEARIFGAMPARPALWHPADCIGDCGAAAGAVLLAIACAGLGRGYARATRVILAASDGAGARRALSVAAVRAPRAAAGAAAPRVARGGR